MFPSGIFPDGKSHVAFNINSKILHYLLVVGNAIGTNNTNNGGFVETKKMVLLK